ncbi:MAG: DUF4157 domain-containing protein [Vicinamibacterales bacterium]
MQQHSVERDIAQRGLRSTARPLDPSVRGRLEPSFNHDLGHIRIHADSEAGQAAAALDAAAYTVGSEIAFGAGFFAPESPGGLAVLSHEVAHVIQNDAFPFVAPGSTVSHAGDATERDASAAADAVMAGALAPAPGAPAAAVSLFPLGPLGPFVDTITAGSLSGELGAAGLGGLGGAGAGGAGLAGAGAEAGIFAGGLAGPLAALAGSGLLGYGVGTLGVNKSDEISKRRGYFHDDNGNPQSGTSEAADWGESVDEAFGHDNWLLDKMGGVAGGATAMGGGIVNTAYGLGRGAYDYTKENLATSIGDVDWGRTLNPMKWF